MPRLTTTILTMLLLTFSGCGDDDGTTDTGVVDSGGGSTCLTMDPIIEIIDNHLPSGGDHQLVIPVADVLAGVEMTYDIRGDNTGHTHDIVVTEADFESLQAGTAVSIVSTDNGAAGMAHTHTVDISCP